MEEKLLLKKREEVQKNKVEVIKGDIEDCEVKVTVKYLY